MFQAYNVRVGTGLTVSRDTCMSATLRFVIRAKISAGSIATSTFAFQLFIPASWMCNARSPFLNGHAWCSLSSLAPGCLHFVQPTFSTCAQLDLSEAAKCPCRFLEKLDKFTLQSISSSVERLRHGRVTSPIRAQASITAL